MVFMGGSIGHTYFAPLRRALTTADFVTLWLLSEEKNQAVNHGSGVTA